MTHIKLCRVGTVATSPTTSAKLFIHGFLGSGDDWRETIAGLPEGAACLLVDLPGHGKGGELSPGCATFDDVIHAVAAAIQEASSLSHPPYHGIGYSLGGRILLGLTHHYPELFGQLTVISAFPGFQQGEEDAREARWESDLMWSARMKSGNTDTFLEKWYAQGLFHRQEWSEEARERILLRRCSLDLPRCVPMFELTSAAKMPNYWPLLDTLKIPATFIAGERDVKYVKIGEEIAARNPGIQRLVIPESGHAIPLERPERLAESL